MPHSLQILTLGIWLLLPSCMDAFLVAQTKTQVSKGPGQKWTKMSTRTLADLPSLQVDPPSEKFGGQSTNKLQPTGFFYTTKKNDRWWLVDPAGHLYVHRGVSSIRQTRTDAAAAAFTKKFSNDSGWADQTSQLLRHHHFTGIGPWSDDSTLLPAKHQLTYTKIWSFMGSYGKKRGGTFMKSGHRGYPGDCPFIFDPEFPKFCEQYATRLEETRDEPWLLGHYTDNELPWNIKMLDRYLSLPHDDHGYQAAQSWLQKRYPKKSTLKNWNDEDRMDFVHYAADTYFEIVSKAIRQHDPNHLILGSRFHGSALKLSPLFAAAGKHCDVISVNYYRRWTPEQNRIRQWSRTAKSPIFISEWYAKAEDSGLANTSGAGWLVKTQQDRGHFYQNFTLSLLESRHCVGWDWFRYADNDPDQSGTNASNQDANKGIVNSHYKPYETLLDSMKAVNERTYGIIAQFEQQRNHKK